MTITASGDSTEHIIGATDQTEIGNVSDSLKVNVTNTVPVSGTVAATQSGTWTVQPGNTANTTAWKVDGSAVTQPVSAASLPLPTGASTAALQTTGNSSLSSIDTKTPALGQTTMANSRPVVIASNQTAIPVSMLDVVPANGAITALDTGTSNLTGANGQVYYFGTPTTNSAATFTLASIQEVVVEGQLLGAGGTMVVEVSMDSGAFWLRPNVFQIATQSYANGFTAPFTAVVNVAGMTNVRVRSTVSWSGSGTILVKETVNTRTVVVAEALPGGANTIGSIANISGTVSLPTGASTSALQTTGNTSLSSIDIKTPALVSGRVPVDGSGVTQPVSGTVTANQGGTWNITNISGTVSLPTGAATSALQTTGNSSLASIVTNTAPLNIAQGSTTSGQTGNLAMGAVTTAPPTYTTAQTSPLSLTTAGALRVDGSASTQPISGTITINPLTTTTLINANAIPVDGTKTTYSAVATAFSPGLTPQDIFTITGSASRVVRVTRIEFTATQTLAASVNIALLRRSTANTGGTSTTLTNVTHDTTNAAATAVTRSYTANPTAGTLVGSVRNLRALIPATGGGSSEGPTNVWEFGNRPAQGMVLRGVAEVLCLNLGGTTVAGNVFDVSIEWTEE